MHLKSLSKLKTNAKVKSIKICFLFMSLPAHKFFMLLHACRIYWKIKYVWDTFCDPWGILGRRRALGEKWGTGRRKKQQKVIELFFLAGGNFFYDFLCNKWKFYEALMLILCWQEFDDSNLLGDDIMASFSSNW